MKRNFLSKKGVGIVAAVIVMLVVAVMGLAISSMLQTNLSNSVNYLQSQQAMYLAESGLQAAMYQISKGGGAWTGWSGANPVTLQATLTGYGDYNVSVANPASSNPVITSTGFVPNRTATNKALRVVQATAKNASLFGQYALFAAGSISMSSAVIDSYNSNTGRYNVNGNVANNGNVGTNGNLLMSGSSYIHGNVNTGPSGTFNNQSAVSGTITHTSNVTLPAVVVPSNLVTCSSGCTNGGTINLSSGSQTITSGNYQYAGFNLSGSSVVTIVGPANIYMTGAINLSSTAQIAVSASSTGPVIIYSSSSVNASGSGITNSTYIPSYFQLYGSSSSAQSLNLSGSSAFYGTVYAPNGSLNISGSGGVYGSFIGNTAALSTSNGVHYDQYLANMTTPAFMNAGWKLSGWTEND
ncbi:MAG: hypothetical protein HQL13_03025 [Candidatus Omnitrophica bacterium]|nr:hypothetical protein [Candidatus Omnitrophota bacterium]